jgi:hypothetical protein
MSEPWRHEAGTRQPLRPVSGARSERAEQPSRQARQERPEQRPAGIRRSALGRPPASGPPSPRWGALPPKRGVVLLGVAALVGTLITVLTGSDPGLALGLFVVIGTLAACLAVRTSGVYWIFPVPALSYLVGALIAGLIHDRAADASRTELAINIARWFASGFVAMAIATSLAVAIFAARLLLGRRGSGERRPTAPRQPPASQPRPSRPPPAGGARPR